MRIRDLPIDGQTARMQAQLDAGQMVHGIVSVDPPAVKCDGCGKVVEGKPGILGLNLLILTCGIEFDPRAAAKGDNRRMCSDCRAAAGWGLL